MKVAGAFLVLVVFCLYIVPSPVFDPFDKIITKDY
jgi:hypothetical protein